MYHVLPSTVVLTSFPPPREGFCCTIMSLEHALISFDKLRFRVNDSAHDNDRGIVDNMLGYLDRPASSAVQALASRENRVRKITSWGANTLRGCYGSHTNKRDHHPY